MNFLNGDHLRVISPVTIDGITIKHDDTGKAVYKETSLPMTAKKSLILQNTRLPKHLQKKIEVVSANQPVEATGEEVKTRTKVNARTGSKTSLV